MKEIVTVEEFFQVSKGEAVQRLAYSKEDVAYKAMILKTMKKLGLEIKVDSMGNICGTLKGNGKSDRSILIGSHTDSVKDGGQFDGPVGVVAGLKAVEEIIEQREEGKIQIPCDIEVVVWAAEESNRFGQACIGSKAAEGTLNKESLEKKEVLDKPEQEKETMKEAIDNYLTELHKSGVEFEMTENILSKQEIYRAYEEHIEQYQSLEEQNLDIGIVTSIVAPYRMKVAVEGKDKILNAAKLIEKINEKAIEAEKEEKYRATVPMCNMIQPSDANYCMNVDFMGESAHSGATPMVRRKDAVLEVAKIVLALNKVIQEQGFDFKVFFEEIHTENDSMNKVAGKTQMRLGVDTQGLDETIIEQILESLIEQVAGQRGVKTRCSSILPKQRKKQLEEKNELKIDIRMQEPIKAEDMFNGVATMITQIAHETGTNFFAKISDKAEPVKTTLDMGTQIKEICENNNIKAIYMPSWAGHDIAHVPAEEKMLIFIRSTGGSHNPNEMTTFDAIQKGIKVLTQSVLEDEKQVTRMVDRVNEIELKQDLPLSILDELIVAKKMGVKIPISIMQKMGKLLSEKRDKMKQFTKNNCKMK